MDEQRSTDGPVTDKHSTVGLMADPGVPGTVAAAIADDLAADLARELGGRWSVEVSRETLPLGPDGEIRLTGHAPRLLKQHNWNFVLYLTDLPTRPDGVPLRYDVSGTHAAALISIPAFGVIRVKSKVRALALRLVSSGMNGDEVGAPVTDDLPPAEGSGFVNHVHLLAGMVHNNRPTRMVPALTGVIAAGAGTGAFGIFYGSIASLAVELHPLRLLMISVMGILTLVAWLILRNGLWNPPNEELTPGNRRMDNAATVLTVGTGVGLMFLGLLVAMFVLAVAVMDSDYLASQLSRPAEILDYVHLAWLSSCLGAFAGALGSNFDDEETVRESTYSLRWHERRKMFDNYEGRESESREEQERERIEREQGDGDESSEDRRDDSHDDQVDEQVDDQADKQVEDDSPRG